MSTGRGESNEICPERPSHGPAPDKAGPPALHRWVGRADHYEPRRGGADPALEGKARRGRAGRPVGQSHRPTRRRHRRAHPDLAMPFRLDCPDFVASNSRKRTPFSSKNSTPALLNTLSISARDSWVPPYRPTSMFVMVFLWRQIASARSRTLQFSAARAILTCALVTGT